MRIHVKKVIDAEWGDANYILFREGEFQNPVAILSQHDVIKLRLGLSAVRANAPKAMFRLKFEMEHPASASSNESEQPSGR